MSEASAAAAGSEAQLVRIETTGSPREFYGHLIDEKTTRQKDSIRWTELRLYETANGRFVLAVSGCSVVYHKRNSSCNQGVAKGVREMDEHASRMNTDLVACQYCKPASYIKARNNAVFNMEIDLPKVTVCPTPADVVRCLEDDRGALSLPASLLLESAKQKHAGFRNALSQARPI